jgi:hypothetical protein
MLVWPLGAGPSRGSRNGVTESVSGPSTKWVMSIEAPRVELFGVSPNTDGAFGSGARGLYGLNHCSAGRGPDGS